MVEDHWWKGALKSFSHPLSQDQVRKLVLSTNLEIWKGWLWKMTSLRSFHMDVVAAIHQIFLLVFEAFEPAMEYCWRKCSMGLQWRALSFLTQVLNSHHKGITLWQEKNKWEADSKLLWQKGHKSLTRSTFLLDRFSLVGSLSHSNLHAKVKALGGILVSHQDDLCSSFG